MKVSSFWHKKCCDFFLVESCAPLPHFVHALLKQKSKLFAMSARMFTANFRRRLLRSRWRVYARRCCPLRKVDFAVDTVFANATNSVRCVSLHFIFTHCLVNSKCCILLYRSPPPRQLERLHETNLSFRGPFGCALLLSRQM